jgi:hypothetical protein
MFLLQMCGRLRLRTVRVQLLQVCELQLRLMALGLTLYLTKGSIIQKSADHQKASPRRDGGQR